MNVRRFLRVAGLGIILVLAILILAANARAKSNLWMLEISEQTALSYNQLCVSDGEHLYSLSAWVPAPMFREKLVAAGVDVEDYATIYEQKSYELLVACSEAPVPIVCDNACIRHYYSSDESVVSFRKAEFIGRNKEGFLEYSIDACHENVFNSVVGPEGYGVYDLSGLDDGLYYVNAGGLVELKRSK